MASKFQYMSALSTHTSHEITSNPIRWLSFLNTASNVYKYPFHDQMMIYAQRPDTFACATLDIWNKKMYRWVNRGAKGIALIDDSGPRACLKYVFDIRDTHLGRDGRTPFIWQMNESHHEAVCDHLIETYGLEVSSTQLREALMETAKTCVMDNLDIYLSDFRTSVEGSFLEELDTFNQHLRFRDTLINSVQYMLLYRCGLEPEMTFEPEDFSYITDFNTLATVSQLGFAVNEISKPILMDIGREIRALEVKIRQAQSLAAVEPLPYNNNDSTLIDNHTIEGELIHETDLHTDRGLSDSESDSGRPDTGSTGQIRDAAQDIPEKPSGRDISDAPSERETERTSAGNRSDSESEDGRNPEPVITDESGTGQSGRSDSLDSTLEQSDSDGRRNHIEGTDLQLTELGDYTAPAMLNAFIPGEVLDEFLRDGSNRNRSSLRIVALYMSDMDPMVRCRLLAEEYKTGGIGIRMDGRDFAVHFDPNGIILAPGSSVHDAAFEERALVSWQEADSRIQDLLISGHYQPQSLLDESLDNERTEIAYSLLYLYHDFDFDHHEYTYPNRDFLSGGYPDASARLSQQLADPKERARQMEILWAFGMDYQKDPSILRFHYHDIPAIEDRLLRLARSNRRFQAADDFSWNRAVRFITQDEINDYLSSRSIESKLRTYSYYLQHPDHKERSDYLKELFGIGGQSPAFRHSDDTDSWHDSKGLKFTRKNPDGPTDTVLLKWNNIASRIDHMLQNGTFLTDSEREHIPVFEREHLAWSVVSFANSLPYDSKEERDPSLRFPLYDSNASKAVLPLLDDPIKLDKLVSLMEQETAALPADYSKLEFCQKKLQELQSFRDGTFTLFPDLEHTQPELPVEKPSAIPSKEHSSQNHVSDGQLSLSDFADFDLGESDSANSDDAPVNPVNDTKSEIIQDEMLQPLGVTSQQEYNALKESYPAHLVGFEQHGYYEFYGEDARQAAPLLGEKLLEKELVSGGTIAVTGFRASEWAAQSYKLWKQGKDVYLSGEQADHTHTLTKELLAKDFIPAGMELSIEHRFFQVEHVNFQSGQVSLIDLTFQRNMGFPITRLEDIDYVRSCVEEQLSEVAPAEPVAEAPVSASKPVNYHINEDTLIIGGAKAKFHANIEAIRLLQELESDNRTATPKEQEVLSRYAGWGGIPEAFDGNKPEWANEYAELKSLLTPMEYETARASTLNAHYTSPAIIRSIYEALSNMGFSTGNILEPSCGIGNFFGCLPENMSESKLYGVELDSLTGRIAKQLYPNASITIDAFEKTNFPDDIFDVVVGNVPFGNYQVADKRYDSHHFQIHDYFVAKSLDQVRPGGIVAILTSSGTMDKRSSSTREYFAKRADLLGAVRLPNNAFTKNAGTNVVADILFFQKRDHAPLEMPEWVHLGTTLDGHTVNQYFVTHPEMVLGEFKLESTQFGTMETTVIPIPDADLQTQLHTAVQNIPGIITETELSDTDLEEEPLSIPADPSVQNFSYTIVDNEVYYRENSKMNHMELPLATAERIRGMVELRDTTRKLLDMQLEDVSDEDIHAQMKILNTQYDKYTEKFGLLNSAGNRRAFSQDSSYCLLASLEILTNDGNLKSKADIFTKRTIKKPVPVTSVDTAVDALSVSMGEKARVDLSFMSGLYDKSEEEICQELHGLIFQDPVSKEWQTADAYLSGNVREKLKTAQIFAESNPAFAVNVEYLKQIQPEDISAADIDVRLGVNWIEPEIITQFMGETFQTPKHYLKPQRIQVQYASVTGEWNIRRKSMDSENPTANVTFGTERASGYRLLEDALNQRNTKIYDTVLDAQGNEHRVVNKEQTILAQQKQDSIKDAFKDWIFRDPQRRELLVNRYNERFNSIRPREYDGSHLQFPGMNPLITLYHHQKNLVAHVLYGDNCLAAHTVGSGKTFSCIAAAMESKRLGLCQKSMFVVPNHLTNQWGSDILKLYPNAKILVSTQKDFEPTNRRKFCSRIATGDYDCVVIGHTQFEKIPLSPERQRTLIQHQIDEITEGIEIAKNEDGEIFTIKQMESMKKRLAVKLEKLNNGKQKDNVVTFEQLGIDRLFVDESQEFKNLYCFTKMTNVAGISTTDAQKSSDMYAKCQYMDEITGGRGITFATGTPISNSMTELYTLMRYLQADKLRSMNLQHFDSWAAQFGETITAIELAPEGTGYRAKTRFAKFFNLPELMNTWKECADIQTADMLSLPTPQAKYENILLQPSELQKELVASLAERAELIHSGGIDSSIDNMLKVTNDGRKLALDQRLINPLLPENPNGKAHACAEKVFEIWQKTSDKKLTQVIFCDLSTPKVIGKTTAEIDGQREEVPVFDDVYHDIKRKLTDKGIPENEIAFIHDAHTDAQKATLFAKVRSGEVRVIFGSTFKMGAGTNIQDKLVALHHLDVPWRPSDVEQQEGRILRQGNENNEVFIYRYLTQETFDAYMWVRHEVA